jgi:hypothetical protein
MTIKPSGDLINYRDFYDQAGWLSFLRYINFFEKEFVFFSMTYILYYIFGGMFNLYVLSVISLGYCVLLKSIYDYYKDAESVGHLVALFSIVFMSFLEFHFAWASHLFRQILASTFIIYYMVRKYVYSENCWWALFGAVFTHSTVILFVIIMLIIWLTGINKSTGLFVVFRSVLLALLLSLFFGAVYSLLSNSFMNIPFIGYYFQRLDVDKIVDSTKINVNEYILPNILLYGMLIVSVYYLFLVKIEQGVKSFLIVYVFYSLFMIYVLNSDNYLLSYRMIIYVYIMFPFVLFLPLRYGSSYVTYGVYFLLISISVFRFFRFLTLSIWDYAPLDKIILYPPLMYF